MRCSWTDTCCGAQTLQRVAILHIFVVAALVQFLWLKRSVDSDVECWLHPWAFLLYQGAH